MSCIKCGKIKCCCTKKISTRGLKGEKGDRGPKGEKGDPGEAGSSGSNGSNGTNGTNGTNGVDGVAIYSTYNSETGTSNSVTPSASTTMNSIAIAANTLSVDGDELEVNYYLKYDNSVAGDGVEANLKFKHSETNNLLAERNGGNYSPSTKGVISIKLLITRLTSTTAMVVADFFATTSDPVGDFTTNLNNRYLSVAEVAATFNFAAINTIDFIVTNDAGIGDKLLYTLQKATSEMKKKQ